MKTFRNVSPLGALDLPMVGRIVEAGEEFEVPDEHAIYLEGQVENFLPIGEEVVPDPAPEVTPAAAGKKSAKAGESEADDDHAA